MYHKRAIIAGSFDPFQRGHVWLVKQALKLADTVGIVISYNAEKSGTFSAAERHQLIDLVLREEIIVDRDRITIETVTDEILAVYAHRTGASLLVRGLRNDLDFRYEHDILDINRIAAPEIETVFMMPPSELTLASSSMVKGLLKFDGGRIIANRFAHPCVIDAIERKTVYTTRIEKYDPMMFRQWRDGPVIILDSVGVGEQIDTGHAKFLSVLHAINIDVIIGNIPRPFAGTVYVVAPRSTYDQVVAKYPDVDIRMLVL